MSNTMIVVNFRAPFCGKKRKKPYLCILDSRICKCLDLFDIFCTYSFNTVDITLALRDSSIRRP